MKSTLLPYPLIIAVVLTIQLESISAGMMVTKPGISDEACAKKCREEIEIECRYYKWHKTKLTCFLSARNDTSISHMKKIDRPHQSPGSHSANSWISQLKSRLTLLEKKQTNIKDLRKEIADLRSEVAGLKNSRALTHHLIRSHKEVQDKNMEAINEKADLIKSEAKRMEDAIMTLGELQKSFGKKITVINDDRKSTSLSMALLGQSNKDIKSSIKELSTLSSQVENSIANIRKEMMEVEVRFASLSTDVMEKASNIESLVGPELKNMKNTQTNLAQALSLITKKIMRLTPRIPQMQRLISTNDGMVSAVNKQVRNFNKDIKVLTNRVVFAESELRKFLDPGSKLNKERRLMLSQMREEVAALTSSQRRLQNDVLTEISDRTRLYQELAAMKLLKKQFSSDIVNLRKQYKSMDKNMRNIILNGPQGDLISKILHRQVEVLKKMKLVKADQGDMRQDIETVGAKMNDVTKRLSAKLKGNPEMWKKTEDFFELEKQLVAMNNTIRRMSETNTNLTDIHRLQETLNKNLNHVNETERKLNQAIDKYRLTSSPTNIEHNLYPKSENNQIAQSKTNVIEKEPVKNGVSTLNQREGLPPNLNLNLNQNQAQSKTTAEQNLEQFERLHSYLAKLHGALAALQNQQ